MSIYVVLRIILCNMTCWRANKVLATLFAIGLRMTLNNFTHIVMPLFFGSLGTAFGVAPVFVANTFMLAGGGLISQRK